MHKHSGWNKVLPIRKPNTVVYMEGNITCYVRKVNIGTKPLTIDVMVTKLRHATTLGTPNQVLCRPSLVLVVFDCVTFDLVR